MIRSTKRTWFEVWGTETAQNRFLKGLVAFLIALCGIEALAVAALGLRGPVIFAVSEAESRKLEQKPPRKELLEIETRRVVSAYLRQHHNWEWSDIEAVFQATSWLVAPDFAPKFLQANAAQLKIAKEKKLSQRFHFDPSKIAIDAGTKTARVTGDRILIVEGLRATNPMTLEVGFDFGNRTEANPEGIYIVSEELIQNAK